MPALCSKIVQLLNKAFIFMYDEPWLLFLRLFGAMQILLESADVEMSLSASRPQAPCQFRRFRMPWLLCYNYGI